MGSAETTPTIGLPLFADDDRPTWRGDVNGANNAIDAAFAADRSSIGDTNLQIADIRAHLPANGAIAIGQGELVVNAKNFGAKCDGVTDDTAAIQAAHDSLPVIGGVVTIPTTSTALRIDGTLRIDAYKELNLPGGCTLSRMAAFSGSTAPVVNLAGNHARLTGFGRVTSDNDSPNGVVMFGPPTVTEADFNASMVAGSPTLAIGGVFTTDDVGKSVSVKGAGAAGGWCTGTITAVNGSSATLSTNAGTTISATQAYWGIQLPVAWARSQARVIGNGSLVSRGLAFYSSPQGQTGLTVGCVAEGQTENVGVGVGFNYQANGNNTLAMQFYHIKQYAVNFNDAVENNIIGGFVHDSKTISYIINSLRGVYNVVTGMQGEPGGGSAYNLDVNSTNNVLILNTNTPGSNINLGPNNYIQMGNNLMGQRITAADGLVMPIKTGGYGDADFTRAVATGITALDSSTGASRFQARIGSVWKSVGLWARVLTLTTNKAPGTINAASAYETPMIVTGALPGDKVNVSLNPMPPTGCVWNASVTANDTVTLRITNVTAAAITLATTSVRVDVNGAT